MKKVKSVSLLLFFICLFCLNSLAQRKEITKEEFNRARLAAYGILYKNSNRENYEQSMFSGDETMPHTIVKTVTEYVPPDRRRSFGEATHFDFPRTNPIIESIRIGKTEYRKQKDGSWAIHETAPPQKTNAVARKPKEEKYFLTENFMLDGKSVNLYESFQEFTDEKKNSSTGEIYQERTQARGKYWISKDGVVIKTESESLIEGEGKRIYRNVRTYEFDPNIKIEAPKIKEK
jgi:hypothetical protein